MRDFNNQRSLSAARLSAAQHPRGTENAIVT
jgi:hypothetical protein